MKLSSLSLSLELSLWKVDKEKLAAYKKKEDRKGECGYLQIEI